MTDHPTAPPNASGPEVTQPTPDQTYRWGLGVSNAATIPVTLVVNGNVVGTYPPKTGTTGIGIDPGTLPPLPWHVVARTAGGRALLTMDVTAPPVSIPRAGGGGEVIGAAVRVDLSCGRLDLWAGPPVAGPAPGPGNPGDCDP